MSEVENLVVMVHEFKEKEEKAREYGVRIKV